MALYRKYKKSIEHGTNTAAVVTSSSASGADASNFANPLYSNSEQQPPTIAYSASASSVTIDSAAGGAKKMSLDDEDDAAAVAPPPPYTPHADDVSGALRLPSYEQSQTRGAVGFVNLGFGAAAAGGDDAEADDVGVVRKKRADSANSDCSVENPYDTLPERGADAAAVTSSSSPNGHEYSNPLYATSSSPLDGADVTDAVVQYATPDLTPSANAVDAVEAHYDTVTSPRPVTSRPT